MTPPIVPTGDPDTSDLLDGPSVAEADDSVAPDADAPDVDATADKRRRTRRLVRWSAAVLVLAGVVAAFLLIPLPYYVIQPGSVRPSEARISVDGAESFVDDGEILFTTVMMRRATPALLAQAALDDTHEVRSSDEVYPDGDSDRGRQLNLQRMDMSKLIATRVALDHVGIDATFAADGARVLGLSDDSPSAGLIEPGDVIVAVDGGEIGMPSDIASELDDRRPGDEVPVVIRRTVEPERAVRTELDVVLGGADDGDGGVRPVLGVEVEPSDPRIESDVVIAVDSGDVSGPSAGLAWTLGIIDRLTPGSLTGGRRIAVTGEIFDDGSVGPVGGLAQKVAAVKRAGIDVFIHPAEVSDAELAEMRRIAGDELKLEPVSTIDEAVEVLAPGGVERPH